MCDLQLGIVLSLDVLALKCLQHVLLDVKGSASCYSSYNLPTTRVSLTSNAIMSSSDTNFRPESCSN